MDFTSGERLFHILMPWSNIEFFENCSLNRGVLVEEILGQARVDKLNIKKSIKKQQDVSTRYKKD